MLKKIRNWFYWNGELVIIGAIISVLVIGLIIAIIGICVCANSDTTSDYSYSIANPANPLNPVNPLSPINRMR